MRSVFDTQSEISLSETRWARELKLFKAEANVSALRVPSIRQMRAKGTAERESSCFMTVALRRLSTVETLTIENVFSSKRRWFGVIRNPRVRNAPEHAHDHSRGKSRNALDPNVNQIRIQIRLKVRTKITPTYFARKIILKERRNDSQISRNDYFVWSTKLMQLTSNW